MTTETITGPGNRLWETAGEWSRKDTSRGLLEAVVIEERTTSPVKSYSVLVRVTPTDQEPKTFFKPASSVEAGNQLIAEQFAKAV